MKKLFLVLLVGMFLISLTSAYTWGEHKQNNCINLAMVCPILSCNETIIQGITSPDSSIIVNNAVANHTGTMWNYTLCSTSEIGIYNVYGYSTNGTTNETFIGDFRVGGGMLGFFILGFILFYGLTFLGIGIKNSWVSLIGCIGVCLLGLYTSFNGIDIYKNDLTSAMSYITIAIGLGIGFEALMEITYK